MATTTTTTNNATATSNNTTTWVILGSRLNGNYTETKDSSAPCLIFDSVESVDASWPLEVTAYPVESGTYVSDHVQERNEQYSLTGWVSNTPFVGYSANQIGYASLGSGMSQSNSRVKQAIAMLKQIKSARQPVTFVTEYEVLTNMVVRDISFTQNAQTADCMAFKVQFEKVRFATAQSTNAKIANAANKKKVSSNVAAGSNTKVQAPSTGSYYKDAVATHKMTATSVSSED